MTKSTSILLLLFAVVFYSCKNETTKKATNKFSDEDKLRIAQLCDERKGEALKEYLTSANAILRAEAAMACASIGDTSMAPALSPLMNDNMPEVRTAAYYAIGMLGNPAVTTDLMFSSSNDTDPIAKGASYEAMGRMAAKAIASNSNSKTIEDCIHVLDFARFETEEERLGWAKGAFHIHMAGSTDERLMERMPFVLQKTGGDSRLACAYAMARFKGDWFKKDKSKKYVLSWCQMERNSDVRMVQMSMLARINDDEAVKMLKGYLLSDSQDQSVKVSALRAAAKVEAIKTSDIIHLLNDQDDYVVQECLLALETKNYLESIDDIVSKCSSRSTIIKAGSLKLANKASNGTRGEEIWSAFQSATSEYDKVHYAHALSASPAMASKCLESAMAEKSAPVKYALTEAIIEMHHGSNWPASENYSDYCTQLFATGDIGLQALVAVDLREEKLNAAQKTTFNDSFNAALGKLNLPKEIETYNEIVRTINSFGLQKLDEKKVEYNHAIDWKLVSSIPSDQKVIITTSKGEVEMELKVNDAPGSVASFVQLVKSGFYDGKYFHRVIPNFVVQGGCPRGDGMGGTDYTLRSEFSLHDYRPGAVGLASSGPDTESCQWFVTHVSTPHLEGRYTIFGYVTKGLDVIKKINVGDKIESIKLVE